MSRASGYQLQVIQQGLTVPRYNEFKWHGEASMAEAVSFH
jgi:hypothetical protein